jgi:hypothetical protein
MSRLVEREAVDSASVAGDSLAYWPSPRPTSSGNGTARPSEARMSTYQLDQWGGGHNSDASYGRGWKEKGDRSAWREERGEEKSYVLNDVAIHQWAISDQDEGATFITCSHPQDGKHRIASRKADR